MPGRACPPGPNPKANGPSGSFLGAPKIKCFRSTIRYSPSPDGIDATDAANASRWIPAGPGSQHRANFVPSNDDYDR